MSQTYLDISPLPTILYGTEIETKIFISYTWTKIILFHTKYWFNTINNWREKSKDQKEKVSIVSGYYRLYNVCRRSNIRRLQIAKIAISTIPHNLWYAEPGSREKWKWQMKDNYIHLWKNEPKQTNKQTNNTWLLLSHYYPAIIKLPAHHSWKHWLSLNRTRFQLILPVRSQKPPNFKVVREW